MVYYPIKREGLIYTKSGLHLKSIKPFKNIDKMGLFKIYRALFNIKKAL